MIFNDYFPLYDIPTKDKGGGEKQQTNNHFGWQYNNVSHPEIYNFQT